MIATVSRWWTEFVAAVGDVVPLPLATVLLMAGAALVALGWFHWPRWWPRRRPGPWGWLGRPGLTDRLRRLGRWRPAPPGLPRWLAAFDPRRWLAAFDPRRWRRRTATAGGDRPGGSPVPPPRSTDVPAALADRYADQGRYAEAVRERLRAMVVEVTDHGVLTDRPSWTVTELADVAGRTEPAAHPVLTEAGDIFSDVWYGEQPALPGHDRRMRELAGQLRQALDQDRRPAGQRPGRRR
ncbi:DUF4129 domain-containing protein [Solwaraspora sp. WMMA2080]|uniref:DUF4129 domain-containing protein n=1 Tax=unclassified Solwaraspora TaxID=2627926 RepID=UPI00248AC820|nr:MULTISPECIES: DUF4129 domain-containing protein [unclassified Solwaraspora]WBB96141.1 DUF4129 domain-containing protein [Solwaraspora sp. WMMA2059]WBC19954.1 DUF4129 domain-containing protein [Solwaraspora sp. WMMA2080]